jgi:hypothetical protein
MLEHPQGSNAEEQETNFDSQQVEYQSQPFEFENEMETCASLLGASVLTCLLTSRNYSSRETRRSVLWINEFSV